MLRNDLQARIEAKSPEQRFMRILEQEFEFAPRVAQVILEEEQTR